MVLFKGHTRSLHYNIIILINRTNAHKVAAINIFLLILDIHPKDNLLHRKENATHLSDSGTYIIYIDIYICRNR